MHSQTVAKNDPGAEVRAVGSSLPSCLNLSSLHLKTTFIRGSHTQLLASSGVIMRSHSDFGGTLPPYRPLAEQIVCPKIVCHAYSSVLNFTFLAQLLVELLGGPIQLFLGASPIAPLSSQSCVS